MKIAKYFRQFLVAGVIAGAMVVADRQPATASCINTSPIPSSYSVSRGRYGDESRDISIDRQIYTTVHYMQSDHFQRPASYTCKIRPVKTGSFEYAVGFPDGVSSAPVTVTIYLDGNEVSKQTIYPGKLFTNIIDISGARNLAVEATCTSASSNCEKIWFTKFKIDSPESPGERGEQ